MCTKLKVIKLIDDNLLFRTNLKTCFKSNLGCNVFAEAFNGIDFLDLSNIAEADVN